jgi:hypothetical protein
MGVIGMSLCGCLGTGTGPANAVSRETLFGNWCHSDSASQQGECYQFTDTLCFHGRYGPSPGGAPKERWVTIDGIYCEWGIVGDRIYMTDAMCTGQSLDTVWRAFALETEDTLLLFTDSLDTWVGYARVQ